MSETGDLEAPDRDNEPDILRLRAEARRVLNDPNRLGVLFVELVPVRRDSEGRLLPPFCDARSATVQIPGTPDRHYTREPGETLEDFKARLIRDLPVRNESREMWWDRGGPGVGMFSITLSPREDSPSS